MSAPMIFLKLTLKGETIVGDAEIDGFKKCIALNSVSWGASKVDRTAAKTSDGSVKNLKGESVRISKFFDGASTVLFGAMESSKQSHIGSSSDIERFKRDNVAVISMAVLAGHEPGEEPLKLMEITLRGCSIREISTSAGGGGKSTEVSEDLKLSFDEMKLDYFPADAKTYKRGAAISFTMNDKSER